MDIHIKQERSRGYALAKDNEKQAGMMTYSITGPNLIIIDYTEIKPEFQDKTVGEQLFYKVVEMAKKNHIKIIPVCPFAAAMFNKFSDVDYVLK